MQKKLLRLVALLGPALVAVFCPSCHQKRARMFAEHIEQEVLNEVPIRQYLVTIPKMLRLCYKH